MASVPVMITGVLWDHATKAGRAATFMGEAHIVGLEVGGGPMPPQGPVDPGYSPPWARPPVDPGYSPPWARPTPPHPAHPIELPPEGPPPTGTPDDDGFIKPPPEQGGWAYHQDYGWLYSPAGGAGPKGGQK